jgi:heme-degrading monooxygenase HmoA
MQLFDATALSKIVAEPSTAWGCPAPRPAVKANIMTTRPSGTIAVIFVAQRTLDDDAGYRAAAAEMDALASTQPGYVGIDSVRGDDGLGITVSYWADDKAAKNWRDHPRHAAIRDQGRGKWYTHYDLHVAEIARSYDWVKS